VLDATHAAIKAATEAPIEVRAIIPGGISSNDCVTAVTVAVNAVGGFGGSNGGGGTGLGGLIGEGGDGNGRGGGEGGEGSAGGWFRCCTASTVISLIRAGDI
jgi:hypothetical protein